MKGSSTGPAATTVRTDRRLRTVGAGALAGLVIEAGLGSVLARAGPPYPTGYLGAHIGIAIALVLLTGWAFGVAARGRPGRLRASAALTHLATLGATVSGLVFLFVGQANAALYGMEGLAAAAIAGTIVLVLWGSVEVPRASALPE